MSYARILPSLLVLAVAVLAGGCSRAQAVERRLPNCHHILISSAEETGSLPAEVFSVSRTIDLTFTVGFQKSFGGSHVLELRVFTPDGNLYRKMLVPITTDRSRETRLVQLPGHRRPVAERRLRGLPRGPTGMHAVDVAFPVAGTDIISAGLYGTWRVEAHLDGGRTACQVTKSFTLTR